MLKVKVEGFKEAKTILDGLPNNMQKSILVAALRQSVKPMLTSARSKVPVKSGKLKKQLRIVRHKDRNASKTEVAVAVKPVFDKSKKSGAVNQYYGKFVHEGTAERRVSRKGKMLVFENEQGEKVFLKSVKGIKATPFLEMAYSETGERTISIFGDELAAAVEKYVQRNFKPVK
nr:MAG TPA: Minor capsid protein [Caudoviricetes sp.]